MTSTASQADRPPRWQVVATARALALSCHPIPALAVTALTAGLAAQAGATLTGGALVTLAMLGGQLSIGWCNDVVDAERDRAVHRTDKPVAAGAISARITILAAVPAVIIAAGASLAVGWLVFAAVMISVVCGWAYDLGLKATAWSWLPYALAFGTLPGIATFAAAVPRWPAAWAVAAGALFGVAAHFANVLPDLLDDEVTGVRGLPHRMGARVSALAGPLILVVASIVISLGQPGPDFSLRIVGLGVTVVVAVWAAASALRDAGSRRYFFAVIAIALLDVLFFAVSGAKI